MFRSRGGGGIGFYNNRGEEPNFSIFPESLGPKGSDWCSFQVDGPPQAILEPRRVRVTLIPGSTLPPNLTNMNVYACLHITPTVMCIKLIPKTIGNRKRDCAWGCAGVKKLNKNQLLSTNHQNPYLLRLVMICAQQLIFLQFFNTRASSRTISFSISNSFWY